MGKNTIDLKTMYFVCGDFKTAHEIVSGCEQDQWIEFSSKGTPIIVRFDCEVDGYVDSHPGDYWTSPSSETIIEKIDIYITGFSIDDAEIEVDGTLRNALNELVKNKIE